MGVINLEDGKDQVPLPTVQINMIILTLNPELPQFFNTRFLCPKGIGGICLGGNMLAGHDDDHDDDDDECEGAKQVRSGFHV